MVTTEGHTHVLKALDNYKVRLGLKLILIEALNKVYVELKMLDVNDFNWFHTFSEDNLRNIGCIIAYM